MDSLVNRYSSIHVTYQYYTHSIPVTSALPDHVNLADRLMNAAGAFPVFGEESGGIGNDFYDFTLLMRVGAAAQQEVAEFI